MNSLMTEQSNSQKASSFTDEAPEHSIVWLTGPCFTAARTYEISLRVLKGNVIISLRDRPIKGMEGES